MQRKSINIVVDQVGNVGYAESKCKAGNSRQNKEAQDNDKEKVLLYHNELLKQQIGRTKMEQYCVRAVRTEEWGYDKYGQEYRTEVIMQHIMNEMAKEGWVVRSTTANGDYCIMITFAKEA